MNASRYLRNAIYIATSLQNKIKDIRLLFLGTGLSSTIAECCLRTGFENITLIDKDDVDISNLNRQDYTETDINKPKAEALFQRLKTINSAASIHYHKKHLDEQNVSEYIEKTDYVINSLDFETGMFFKADRISWHLKKTVISPFNIGYVSVCYVITPDCKRLIDDCINIKSDTAALEVGKMLIQHLQQEGMDVTQLIEYLTNYTNSKLPFIPQLAIGSYLSAALVTQILLSLVDKQPVPKFPKPIVLGSKFEAQ